MNVSDCCGAETIVEKRSDYPHVYDDEYDLIINLIICTQCKKIVGLFANPDDSRDSR